MPGKRIACVGLAPRELAAALKKVCPACRLSHPRAERALPTRFAQSRRHAAATRDLAVASCPTVHPATAGKLDARADKGGADFVNAFGGRLGARPATACSCKDACVAPGHVRVEGLAAFVSWSKMSYRTSDAGDVAIQSREPIFSLRCRNRTSASLSPSAR